MSLEMSCELVSSSLLNILSTFFQTFLHDILYQFILYSKLVFFRDHQQIWLLILSEFKELVNFYSPRKYLKNYNFLMMSEGNRSKFL